MLYRLKSKYRTFKKWYKNIYKHQAKIDIGNEYKLPWKEKLHYNLLGFTDQEYYNFNLKHNDYHNYISYYERMGLDDANGRFAYIIGEKLIFERFFGQIVNVPHIFAWNRNGVYIDPNTSEIVDIIALLKNEKRLIVKPTRSNGGGYGVHAISYTDNSFLLDNNIISSEALIDYLLKLRNCIVVQFIQQAEYSSKIYSNSTNSIRIATGRMKNGEIEVLLSFHRFGSSTSGIVDNISSGGVFSLIDENGCLSGGRSYVDINKVLDRHPDTGAIITETIIPGWKKLCTRLIEAHKKVPYYSFLAWDVVLDQNNNPYILEINRGSDLGIQCIKPLRNEKLGFFMRENGMLSSRVDK